MQVRLRPLQVPVGVINMDINVTITTLRLKGTHHSPLESKSRNNILHPINHPVRALVDPLPPLNVWPLRPVKHEHGQERLVQ